MDFTLEKAKGWPSARIFGVDEAGRGPWAGPVTAAAICLPPDFDLSVDEWESTYADLGGPGNWSQERNFRYKLQTRGKSLLKKVAKVGIVLGVLFHLLVYIDCGDHGEPGRSRCGVFLALMNGEFGGRARYGQTGRRARRARPTCGHGPHEPVGGARRARRSERAPKTACSALHKSPI